MLIAQALGEYGAIAALSEGIRGSSIRLEQAVGDWGTEGLIIAVVTIVVWRVAMAVR